MAMLATVQSVCNSGCSNAVILNPSFSLVLSRFLLTITDNLYRTGYQQGRHPLLQMDPPENYQTTCDSKTIFFSISLSTPTSQNIPTSGWNTPSALSVDCRSPGTSRLHTAELCILNMTDP